MRPDDQASRLRQLVQQARQARTIAVCSGKGGVGKSNVCLNLSILLSAAGHRVALVDADLGLANLDILIDLDVSANLSHVISGVRRLQDVTVDLPTGVQFVPGASGLARLADLSSFERAQLVKELTVLEEDNDIILADCGAGIGANVLHLVSSADEALVVTSPEPTSVTDAYAVIKILTQRAYPGEIRLVVNLAENRQEARWTQQRLADVAQRFLARSVSQAGYVLTDPKVGEAVRRREPFVLAFPHCTASRCLATVANRLASSGGGLTRKDGFFRRVANWFG